MDCSVSGEEELGCQIVNIIRKLLCDWHIIVGLVCTIISVSCTISVFLEERRYRNAKKS